MVGSLGPDCNENDDVFNDETNSESVREALKKKIARRTVGVKSYYLLASGYYNIMT